jgi:hypothetical protein
VAHAEDGKGAVGLVLREKEREGKKKGKRRRRLSEETSSSPAPPKPLKIEKNASFFSFLSLTSICSRALGRESSAEAASSTRLSRSALSRAAAATRRSFGKEQGEVSSFLDVVFAIFAVVAFSFSLSSTALSNALAAPAASPLASQTSAHRQCALGHEGCSSTALAACALASLVLPIFSSAAAAFALGLASFGFPSAAAS